MWIVDDVRVALRALGRAPGFLAGGVLVLGLGLGVSLFALRLLDVALFRPLPGARAPQELASVRVSVSYPAWRDLREFTQSQIDLAAVSHRTLVADVHGVSRRIDAGVVTGNFFSVWGAGVTAGRPLREADDAPGAPAVAVVSHRLARELASPVAAAVGRTLRLNGGTFEIVGVASPEFRRVRFGAMRDVWVPIQAWALVRPTSFEGLSIENRSWSWLMPFGRVRPEGSFDQAQALLRVAGDAQAAAFPNDTRTRFGEVLNLLPAVAAATGELPAGLRRAFASTLIAASVALFLLACANVAHLVGARAATRARELATRRALGGSRHRLVNLLATEALLLSLAGSIAGCALMAAIAAGLAGVELPGGITLGSLDLAPNGGAFASALGLAFVAALLFGLGPALRASGERSMAQLRGSSVAGVPGRRTISWSVTAQVALGVVLLSGATLLARAAASGLDREVGFEPGGMTIGAYDLSLARVEPGRASHLHQEALRAIGALAGVESVTLTQIPPLSGSTHTESFKIPGAAPPAPGADGADSQEVELLVVGPGYFETLGIALRAGRGITSSDRDGAAGVAVANRAFVERHLAVDPSQSVEAALDREVVLASGAVRVIGIVDDVLVHNLEDVPAPLLYRPLFQQRARDQLSDIHVIARFSHRGSELPLAAFDAGLRAALPGVPVYDVGSLDERFEAAVGPQRFVAAALGGFGALGLLLLASGTYATVALSIARRRREIGVRSALGAAPGALVRQFVRQGFAAAGLGIVVGLPLALVVGLLARGLLFGVQPADPVALLVGALSVAGVALFAAWIPARRAASIEPAQVLRAD